jgi:3-deoxy-D-manno-octulosonic-acid transferase
MFFFYRILTNLILFISPIIILIRLLQKKEDPLRFREKFNFYSKKKKKRKIDMVSWCECR